MAYNNERLTNIYDKTDGRCHLCHKKLSFSNYGIKGAKGNWEVEHSIARVNGGTNHLNNLYPACIECSRDKGTYHTKTVRGWYGNTSTPLSKARKQQIEEDNEGFALLGFGALTLFGIGILKNITSSNFIPRKQILKNRRNQNYL